MSVHGKVAKAGDPISDAHLACRTFGHAWKLSGVDKLGTDVGMDIVCTRCKAHRYDVADAQGYLVSRGYVYPDGYRREKAQPRHEYRIELVLRVAPYTAKRRRNGKG